MSTLRHALDEALVALSAQLGQPIALNEAGAVGLSLGEPAVEVIIEWIEPGECVAVHAAVALPAPISDNDGGATTLLKAHAAGAGTRGCAFFLLPDGTVRLGATLLGPSLSVEGLIEAIRRVAATAQVSPG